MGGLRTICQRIERWAKSEDRVSHARRGSHVLAFGTVPPLVETFAFLAGKVHSLSFSLPYFILRTNSSQAGDEQLDQRVSGVRNFHSATDTCLKLSREGWRQNPPAKTAGAEGLPNPGLLILQSMIP